MYAHIHYIHIHRYGVHANHYFDHAVLFFKAIAKQDMHDDTATKDQHNNNNNDSNYHCTIVIWKRNMYVLLDKHIIKIINVQCHCMYKLI